MSLYAFSDIFLLSTEVFQLMYLFIWGRCWGRRGERHAVEGEHKYTAETIFPANTNKDETHFRLENKRVNET